MDNERNPIERLNDKDFDNKAIEAFTERRELQGSKSLSSYKKGFSDGYRMALLDFVEHCEEPDGK